ncbi:MAG: 50S ribosomal protein L10 [Candidatus Andersenbacteria bacterium RIFCSPHIGHO2_12_FULL_46_9]|nr:MAG: 50S ribosomal protein L10 [Parcubacteria group bacterium GW2011_GWA2_45_14]OGY33180.1 MAG: 50S ribosomal protein L10 [Candidatus Andersenbacteria bacterium RIFCSPHIGHO2_02_FULL_46_16]OGY38538.1 MAG: 50S ribosomal protein L10 [Candidatus Andersenbacteria bacterium RIFCSPHIGHO2_12_FULL_46_9]OGY40990.1 MAG: 50S ribosomal protein L10 [Candidatus Andersenbacteria bacterium RIFCSPLOWO2_12_FULL_45_8]HBE90345.1 50S ribosomal protein L10 [Candidatus Andersenbacteria bacterium]
MALTRQQKEDIVSITQDQLGSATSFVMITFDQLTVVEINQLRDKLHAVGGRLRIVPKRLLKIILQQIKLDFDPLSLVGQVAVAWADDAVAPAKILNDFAKKNKEKIQLMSGSLEGNLLTIEQVKALATLPSREQLLSQLVSVLTGPARGLVTVLSGVQRNFVQVLQAIADKKTPQ